MSGKIDINVADAETLTTISGIGPALATRIVEYRETVHPFEEVIELAAVPGISEKMVRGFEEFVTVQATAVSPVDEDVAEIPLLDAPDPVEMLAAPKQPEALLVAELPEADDAPADEPANNEPTEALPERFSREGLEEREDEAATAVAAPDDPDIEAIPLAEPDPTMPEPSMRASFPAPPAANWESMVQRRGCLSTLLGATFGAILGAVLTLAILAAINNGSLNYAANNSAVRQQLDTEVISRTNEINQISTRMSLVATEEAAANQALQLDFVATNEALQGQLDSNDEIISYLATRSGDFELRLQEVAGAADTFIGFLDGLRFLLDDLEGGTMTPTPTPTLFAGTVSPTPTPLNISTPTTAVQSTRTPQPTATPFVFPTNTPAPQP